MRYREHPVAVRVFTVCLIVLLSAVCAVVAAPYHGEVFTYHQPDGEALTVRLFGDEFFAYQETEDGYLVVRDDRTRELCYARLVGNGTDIVSTGVRAGPGRPPPAGLRTKQRLTPAALLEKRRPRREALGRDEQGRFKPEIARVLFRKRPPENGGKPGVMEGDAVEPSSDTNGEGGTQFAPADGDSVYLAGDGEGDDAYYAPPPTGSGVRAIKGLTLLAYFPDVPANRTVQEVDAYLNDPDYTGEGNATSIYGYFLIQSNGKVVYKNVVTEWFQAANNKSYYDRPERDNGLRAKELVREGLEALAAQGFDFRQCDADGNGVIDGVNIFFAGPRLNDWAEGLWPHSGNTSWSGFTAYGLSTSFAYQITDLPATMRIGTYCHENGHMLFNFPDLYQYNGNAADMWNYSLMSGYVEEHPGHFDPFLKIQSGWANVVDLDSSSHQRCVVQVDRNHFYRFRNPSRPSESFLFEVRHNSGYEGPYGGTAARNPTAGLVAYHALQEGNNTQGSIFTGANPVSYATPYKVMVVEANPSTGYVPWYTDPTPRTDDSYHAGGKSEISDTTWPSLKFWASDGRTVASGAHIHSISTIGSTMTFVVGSGALTNQTEMGLTTEFLSASVEAGINAGNQQFSIYNAGTGSFSYVISDDVDWLAVSPSSGTVTDSETDLLTASFSTAALAGGSHTATLTVSAAGVANSPMTVPVTILITGSASLPVITVQPTNAVHLLGNESFTLSVGVDGSPTPTTQWYKDAVAIPGGTSTNLTLSSVTAAHAGGYTLVAVNSQGAVTSQTAVVTVNDHPYITLDRPAVTNVKIPSGVGLILDCSVVDDGYGGSSLSYAWSVESVPVGGSVTWDNQNATNTAVRFSTDGAYRLRLTASDGINTQMLDYDVDVGAGSTPPVSTDSLVVHYVLDEDSGTNAVDAAGGDHNGVVSGGATWTGSYIELDGVNGRVNLPNDNAINTLGPYAKRSIALWFRADSLSGRQVVFEEGGVSVGLNLYLADSTLYWRGWNGNTYSWNSTSHSVAGISAGRWYHVALVLDPGTGLTANAFRAYLDGAFVASGSGAPLATHNNGGAIGAINSGTAYHDGTSSSNADYFHGATKDFRLYNRALAESEITVLSQGGGNLGPLVDAGAPLSGYAGALINIDAAVTDDGQPQLGIVTTLWTVVSGPDSVTFGDASVVDTTVSAGTLGSYVLRLVADDSRITTFDDTSCEILPASGPGGVRFEASTYSVSEAGTNLQVGVERLTGAVDGAVSVDVAAVNGTATNGVDFSLLPGTLNWADQESGVKAVTIAITDNAVYEGDKTFSVSLFNPGNGVVLFSPSNTLVTIEEDDPVPSFCMQITFTNMLNRAVLTDFPALVKLTPGNTGNYTGFLDMTNGWDLRFWTNSALTGTELAYEVESFDSSGASYIWVKVPALGHNTSIWASWGLPEHNSQASYTTNGLAWNDSFVGVWHLGESGGGANLRDSTPFRNHPELDALTAASPGMIGNGRHFDGNGAYIQIPDSPSLSVTGSLTMEAWGNIPVLSTHNLMAKDGNHAYRTRINSTSFWGLFNDGSGYETASVAQLFNAATWYHMACVMDFGAGEARFYVNGQLVGAPQSLVKTSIKDTTGTLLLGSYQVGNSGEDFYGVLDEARITAGVRSADWIWASYMNQGTEHLGFQSYGPPKIIGAPETSYTLTVNSPYGWPEPSGVTTNMAGSLIHAAIAGSPLTLGTTQYVATGWISTGSLANGWDTNASFTITNDTTLTWQWTTNYWIKFQILGE